MVASIREKLPPAFESVEPELKGNPAVGILRENVVIGMLVAFLGEEHVESVEGGVHPDIDCYVGKQPVSIKTISSKYGGIRIKWTSETAKAEEFLTVFQPVADLLFVLIQWEGEGYIKYIPLEVQQEVFGRLSGKYLDYRPGTNTRGVNLSKAAKTQLLSHHNVFTLPIAWPRGGSPAKRYERWIDYWKDDEP